MSFSASTKGLDLQQMANMYNDDGMRGEAPDLHMCNLKVLSFGVWVVLCCVGCVVWHPHDMQKPQDRSPSKAMADTSVYGQLLRALSAQFLVSSPLG